MKLFLDMSPALDPALPEAAATCFGIAAAALSADDRDVYFMRGDDLLPRSYIAWALNQDWESGRHLRKLAASAVQFAHRDRAMDKYLGEAMIGLFTTLDPAEACFDRSVHILTNPAVAHPPDFDDGALDIFRLSDLVICPTEIMWRDYEAIFCAEEVAPAIMIREGSWPPGGIDRQSTARPKDPTKNNVVTIFATDKRDDLSVVWQALREGGDALHSLRFIVLPCDAKPFPMSETPSPPRDLSERVTVAPFQPNTERRQTISRSRAVIAPSVVDRLGRWPRQANALGAPVIAALGGGASEVCDPTTTLVYDASAPNTLTDALCDVAQSQWSCEDRTMLVARSLREDWISAGQMILDAARRAAV